MSLKKLKIVTEVNLIAEEPNFKQPRIFHLDGQYERMAHCVNFIRDNSVTTKDLIAMLVYYTEGIPGLKSLLDVSHVREYRCLVGHVSKDTGLMSADHRWRVNRNAQNRVSLHARVGNTWHVVDFMLHACKEWEAISPANHRRFLAAGGDAQLLNVIATNLNSLNECGRQNPEPAETMQPQTTCDIPMDDEEEIGVDDDSQQDQDDSPIEDNFNGDPAMELVHTAVAEVKSDMHQELRQEALGEVRVELKQELKEDMKDAVRKLLKRKREDTKQQC